MGGVYFKTLAPGCACIYFHCIVGILLIFNDIINTSYQKLPFGSGDDPGKLFFQKVTFGNSC